MLQRVGRGGMGTVYRARDTRLARDVAIKVINPEIAADPDRIARFRREATIVAALNHPGIVVIHDTGHENGLNYLVTEFVDGVSLSLSYDGKSLVTAVSTATGDIWIADGIRPPQTWWSRLMGRR